MRLPDWRTLVLNDGILAEPAQDADRIILWLPGTREGQFRIWERVSNVPRAEVSVEQGFCLTPATSIQARQHVRGFFGKLLPRARPTPAQRTWLLPNGESAEQWGETQTDLILVWPQEGTALPEESVIKARWPAGKQFRKVATDLFLVSGLKTPGARIPDEPAPTEEPEKLAEQFLAAARQAGDRAKETSALTDLGIFYLGEGDPRRAVPFLKEALTIARQIEDPSRESEALGNLGLAALGIGEPQLSLQLVEEELACAQAAGNRFAEKIALDHLGRAHAGLKDAAQAVAFSEQALALARKLGDRQHEADLLWYLGIQHADLGNRDQAIVASQEAVALLEKMGKPQAAWFADHLQRYRAGDSAAWPGGAGPAESAAASPTGSSFVSAWAAPEPMAEQPARGPGWLRMAISAAASMAKFLGSGLKTVPPEVLQKRLGTCASCEHHTGLRCRLCGCFTRAKALMAHEDCPIGKWPV